MTLISKVTYEADMKAKDVSSKTIIELLRDVRDEIGNLGGKLSLTNLQEVLDVVEKGSYEIAGKPTIKIDLSDAKGWIRFYRDNTEGGCQSCKNKLRDLTDCCEPQDAFIYCKVLEEDSKATQKACGYNGGFSPKVDKHYSKPCGKDWEPKFSPPLAELIEEQS